MVQLNLSKAKFNNATNIYLRLKNYGYSENGIAALLGSIYSESSFLPTSVQNADDQSYLSLLDRGNKTEKSFSLDSKGFGLCQWTYHTRKSGLYRFIIDSVGRNFGNLNAQVDFINKELSSTVNCFNFEKNSAWTYSYRNTHNLYNILTDPNRTLQETNEVVFKYYEAPEDQSIKNQNLRYERSEWCLQNIIKNANSLSNNATGCGNSLVSVALDQVGKSEDAKRGKNKIEYNDWWYNRSDYSSGAEWCAVFVGWCLHQVGLLDDNKQFNGLTWSAGCGTNVNLYKNTHLWEPDNTKLQPGDVIFFLNSTDRIASHVGLVYQSKVDQGYYLTVEGNTGWQTVDGSPVPSNLTQSNRNESIWVSKKKRLLSGGYFKIIGGLRTSILVGSSDSSISEESAKEINLVDEANKEKLNKLGTYLSEFGNEYYKNAQGNLDKESEDFFNVPRKWVDRYQTAVSAQRLNANSGSLISVDVNENSNRLSAQSLLVTPNFVESPFVILTVGNYTFGSYVSAQSKYRDRSYKYVKFPNYMSSLDVVKINGQMNQYTIKMIYQIQAGNDPNLIDRILGTVGYGKIKISYGDWNAPSFIYKEEEALITKVNSSIDFSSSRITYTIYCTSTALSALSSNEYFTAIYAKPSDEIKKIIFNNRGNILNAFPGMKRNWDKMIAKGLIRTDDAAVQLGAKNGISVLSYLNYLVSCMTSNGDRSTGLRSSNYYLTICEDFNNEYGGTYFKITKIGVSSNQIALDTSNMYEVNIGYPDNNLVTAFNINTDNSWSLLYNYSDNIENEGYTYSIDNNGNIVTEKEPNIMKSSKYNVVTETQRNWWTQMTKFPISASLQVKGLLSPLLLMTYIRINSFFYGQRHISSGIYTVVKQQDSISQSGYRTTLNLLRVGGDTDVIQQQPENFNV